MREMEGERVQSGMVREKENGFRKKRRCRLKKRGEMEGVYIMQDNKGWIK